MIRKVENAYDGQSSDFHSMDAYRLVELASGVRTIRSSKVGETFHPVIGPEAEALALYSGQLKLTPRAGPELDPITIWDVGLGGAANPIVVLKSLGGVHPSVRVLSFDHTLEPLLFAVQNSNELGYLKGWEGWLGELAETGEVHFEWGCTKIQWQFLEGDFPGLLNGSSASSWPVPDAILFDAFSASVR